MRAQAVRRWRGEREIGGGGANRVVIGCQPEEVIGLPWGCDWLKVSPSAVA